MCRTCCLCHHLGNQQNWWNLIYDLDLDKNDRIPMCFFWGGGCPLILPNKKMDGWKMKFPFGVSNPQFQGPVCYLSFRLLPMCFRHVWSMVQVHWRLKLSAGTVTWSRNKWSFHLGWLPRSPMTSIFEGQSFKTRPFTPSKTLVIWVILKVDQNILLMEDIRPTSWYGESTIAYKGFYLFQVVNRISSINSIKTPW